MLYLVDYEPVSVPSRIQRNRDLPYPFPFTPFHESDEHLAGLGITPPPVVSQPVSRYLHGSGGGAPEAEYHSPILDDGRTNGTLEHTSTGDYQKETDDTEHCLFHIDTEPDDHTRGAGYRRRINRPVLDPLPAEDYQNLTNASNVIDHSSESARSASSRVPSSSSRWEQVSSRPLSTRYRSLP
jgi:hypothetical protein